MSNLPTQTPPPGSGPGRTRKSRWRLFSIAIAAVLVGLAFAFRAALPEGLRRIAQSQAASALGTEVRIETVELWLVSGGLRIEGIRVGGQGPSRPGFEIDHATIQLHWKDLLDRTVNLERVILGGLKLRVWRRPGGGVDFYSTIADRAAAQPEPAEVEPPAAAETPTDAVSADTLGAPVAAIEELEPPDAVDAGPAGPAPEGDAADWSVRIGRIEFSDVDVVMHDERFDEPREGALKLEQLAMTAVEFRGRKFGFESIEIEGPTLRFPLALALADDGATESESDDSFEPFEFGVSDFNISRAGVFVLGNQPLDVAFRLVASDVTGHPNTLFPVRLDLTIGRGEEERELEVAGRLGLAPLTFDGRIEWRRLVLANLIAPFSEDLAPWVDAGRSSGELDVTLRFPAPGGDGAIPDGVRARGAIRIDEFALAHGGAKDDDISLAWSSLEVDVREIAVPIGESGARTEVALGRVALQSPVLYLALPGEDAGAGEIASEATSGAAEAEPETSASNAPPADADPDPGVRVVIDSFEVENGGVTLLDRSVRPFYRGKLEKLRLSARDTRWPGWSVGEFTLAANTEDAAALAASGKLSSDARNGEVHIKLEKVPLGPFNPYTTQLSDYVVEDGVVTLTSDVRIENSRFASENSVVLADFDLAERSAGTFAGVFGVPLQLGLALLRDISGDIALSVPVAVGDEGTSVGLGGVIRRALQGAVMSALTSPLKALGMLIPKGKAIESLALPVAFRPGGVETTAEGAERIAALAKILASRPMLAVVLRGDVGESDRPELARQELAALVLAGDDWPEIEGGGWLTQRRVARALSGEPADGLAELSPEDAQALARWTAAVTVPVARFDDLATRRATAVRDELLAVHGVSNARARVAQDSGSGEPGVSAELVPAGG